MFDKLTADDLTIEADNYNDAKGLDMDYPQEIANKMKKGLSNETQKIREIGKVLREDGLSSTEVNYQMSIDEDFIPDVLQSYKSL